MLTLFDRPTRDATQARVDDDLKLFGNFGHLFAQGVQAYGHANYAEKTATQGFYYRNPNTRANIFSLDGGQSLLVGDVLDAQDGIRDGSAGCPAVPITDHRPDQSASPRASRGRSPMCRRWPACAGPRRTA